MRLCRIGSGFVAAAFGRFHGHFEPSMVESWAVLVATFGIGKAGVSTVPGVFSFPPSGSGERKHTLRPIAVSISVIALAVAVADLGTAVVIVATSMAVLFVAGLESRYLVVCAILAALLGVGFIVMKPYRLARAVEFLDKDHKVLAKIDPHGRILEYAKRTASTSDPGYQQRQAKIAVGSGGLQGSG